MCMFSAPIAQVCNTRIFARMLDGAPPRQALIYAMQLQTATDVAMILPVPTPAGAGEEALRFVSLEGHAGFFEELDALFPRLEPPLPMPEDRLARGLGRQAQTLKVHRVGAFEASFVPSRAEFARLDPRFRLADEIMAALPYDDSWGYAVFKLRGDPARQGLVSRLLGRRGRGGRPGTRSIHPMAFVFETRQPNTLFFPTIHVHDGALAELAPFDHQLYFQAGRDADSSSFALPKFELVLPDRSNSPVPGLDPRILVLHESAKLGGRFVVGELIDPHAHAYRYSVVGTGPNRDLEIALVGALALAHGCSSW